MVVDGVLLKKNYQTNDTGCVEIPLNLGILLCTTLNREDFEAEIPYFPSHVTLGSRKRG